ncbi:ABC transporter ATP-binding protein [Halomicrococcus gelatinilyticus]|uniref:ABC transporter ATP-binding protein n=1 Tax=Halomicrococcus gelatinilyticus TaxID=1702103 RepID=UPI002E11F3E4
MTYLEIDDLVKQFGDLTAVDDVSFTVEEGEFVTVVGPSGCGKTTTLRMIAGLEDPTAGTIRIRGDDITSLPAYERDIGVVFQDYALFPHKTVFENIAFGLKMRGASEAEQEAAVEEMLRIINLEGYEDQYPHECSGGEQQRVAVARALAFDPDLVLMDEPLSNLDKKLRQSMRTELKRIQRETGVTTIYVTHNQTEALSMGDNIAVLNDGRLEQFGDPKAAYQDPDTPFVADFLGQSSQVSGTFRHNGSGPEVVSDGGTTIDVTPKDDVTDGDDVEVFLRNELLSLVDGESNGANVFEGEVRNVDYQGSDVNYFVSVPSLGTTVMVSATTGMQQTTFSEGTSVELAIDPADVIYTHP